MCLEGEKERGIDVAQPIHQGVTADRVVTDRRSIRVREITLPNPCDGEVYVYLTSEMTLEPGLLALLDQTRWEIEKVFDETRAKLVEKKSWATTPTAKEMQAHFVALVHNLLLLLQDWQQQQDVENTAATKTMGRAGNRTEENGADPAVDLHRAPAFHAGDVQAHPLAAESAGIDPPR